MPFFEENPLTVARIARRLGRALAQNREASRMRAPWEPLAPPPDSGARDDVVTTLDATIRPVGAGPYRRLAWAPGETHVVRDELDLGPAPARTSSRRSLVYFAQHTDLHICDAQAEARLVGAQGFAWIHPGSDAAHRPQETMATHVFDALIQATNRLTTSPMSGASMAWCIQTGDHTDNRLTAAAQWWLDVLAGRTVTPDTGLRGVYEGVQRSGWRAVWNPDVPGRDRPQRNGFPFLPGVLDAAVAPFEAHGLDVPWLTLVGNHDLLFTGMFGPGPRFGIDKVEPLVRDTGRSPVSTGALLATIGQAWFAPRRLARRTRRRPVWAPSTVVTPDPVARRPLGGSDLIEMIIADDGGPKAVGPLGHGFTGESVRAGTPWWSRAQGDRIQVIGLDTSNHTNGDDGRVGPRQAAWLEDELARHHSRFLDRRGRPISGSGSDRLVIVAGHHNSWAMVHGGDDQFDSGPPLLGDGMVEMLGRFPNVVLWFSGHSHQHRIRLQNPRRDPAHAFWEVSTTSVASWSQQGRLFEVFDNGDATLSILTTVFDHVAPPSIDYPTGGSWTPSALASLSRELAANDNRWLDPTTMAGLASDRNAELVLPVPSWWEQSIDMGHRNI